MIESAPYELFHVVLEDCQFIFDDLKLLAHLLKVGLQSLSALMNLSVLRTLLNANQAYQFSCT
jgi:hypothetical protein